MADAARFTYPTPDDMNPAAWGTPIGDCHWQITWQGCGPWTSGSCGGNACTRRIHVRHNEGCNVAWCDGHAKWDKGLGLVAYARGDVNCLWDKN